MSNFGDKAKQIIGTVAPMLGTVLGGPLGGLAGAALAKALGTDDPKAQETMIASGDPEVLLKLRQAEKELQEHLKQLDIDEEKLHFDDTANARNREIQLKDWTPKVLAYVLVSGFFVVLGIMIFHGTPKDGGAEALLVLLGALSTAFASIIAYYYGSSAGSAAKTDTLSKIASTK